MIGLALLLDYCRGVAHGAGQAVGFWLTSAVLVGLTFTIGRKALRAFLRGF